MAPVLDHLEPHLTGNQHKRRRIILGEGTLARAMIRCQSSGVSHVMNEELVSKSA
jgi:hypothetical protein